MAEKRLTIKMFREAYSIIGKRGWTAMTGSYCNKADKKACPIMALALAQVKRFPSNVTDLGTYAKDVVMEKFGVSRSYILDFIDGVDSCGDTDSEPFRLGHRVRELFIKKA